MIKSWIGNGGVIIFQDYNSFFALLHCGLSLYINPSGFYSYLIKPIENRSYLVQNDIITELDLKRWIKEFPNFTFTIDIDDIQNIDFDDIYIKRSDLKYIINVVKIIEQHKHDQQTQNLKDQLNKYLPGYIDPLKKYIINNWPLF